MIWQRIFSFIFIIILAGVGFFLYKDENPFHLGLDLSGGTELVYQADVSDLDNSDVDDAMFALRDVIERRVNVFGVSEPIVQTEEKGGEQRLVVELPGITDLEGAIGVIGETPTLEFALLKEDVSQEDLETATTSVNDIFEKTGLTGAFLKRAQLQFLGGMQQVGTPNEPIVTVEFTNEGKELFSKITRENIGEILAIFLDGELISYPTINEEIDGGTAQISGNFTPESARELVRNLNLGALPVPIELVSSQSIGPSLGEETLNAGIYAAVIGFLIISIFLILWYRLLGIISVVALSGYMVIMLFLFKIIPVTLTSAGIAGFILSVGMAVDANVLIFERIKEELKETSKLREAISSGFSRAWLSIRDANISSLITAIILFWFGTSLIKGFALVFGIGILVSMFSAITLSRLFIFSLSKEEPGKFLKFLFSSGFKK